MKTLIGGGSTAEEIIEQIREGLRMMGHGREPRDPELLPVLYIDSGLAENEHVRRLLEGAKFPLVIVESEAEFRQAMIDRGQESEFSVEKITALAQGMRSDARFQDLAEVVAAMPALKLSKHELKSSKRPALPKNRKRDRWN